MHQQLSMNLKEIHFRIEMSKHKPWQIYLLTTSILVSLGLYFNIHSIALFLHTIERGLAGWKWLVILGIQGVLIGYAAELLYEQDDGYAKSGSHLFASKDRTFFFRVVVMTLVSGIITKFVPFFLNRATEYPIIQTVGAVITSGILLVHQGSSDWNARTEWPGILAGLILAMAPSLA